MFTYSNTVVTNRNVFAYGQDRVVLSLDASNAHAAQHLSSWHASKRARSLGRALKRRGLGHAGLAGAILKAMSMCLAILGSTWQPVRRMSPVLVIA